MIKKWRDFLFENNNALRYYIFDWDDNLLFMETPLHFQHFENGEWTSVNITPQKFAEIRKEYPDNYMGGPSNGVTGNTTKYNNEWRGDQSSFVEFRDNGPRGSNAFLDDVKFAIKHKKFGPSWDVFLKVLIEGRLFAIVTSRGHEPATLRSAVRYIIENVLTPDDQSKMKKNLEDFNKSFGIIPHNDLITQYLYECYFMGLFSQAFKEDFSYSPVGIKLNQGKQDAINKFVNFVRDFAKKSNTSMKVGFSDDDINFSNAAKELFMKMEKSLDFPENFYVFDTSNSKIKGGIKVKI